MIPKNQAMAITLAAGLCLCLAACGGSNSDGLSGEIKVNGSSTVYPISQQVAEEFNAAHPGVIISVGQEGTGSGFKKFATGETAVSDASRPIKPNEDEKMRAAGIPYIELPVAYDGLSIVVNPGNTWTKQLTLDQLKLIFLEAENPEDKVNSWNDVDPSWPDTKIKMFIPGVQSGTFDYFKEVVAGKKDSIRGDVTASENDNVIVTGLTGDPGAIGFFGAAYYFENRDKVKAIPIINDKGDPVLPTPETIESGEYNPFSRPLFIYVRADMLDQPEVAAFIEYYLQDAPEFAEESGYVALPEIIYDRARDNVRSRRTGTQYVDADGIKVHGPVTDVYQ